MGSTVAMGLAAMAKGRALTPPVPQGEREKNKATSGLVSALPPFANADLPDPAGIVLGGHELRDETLLQAVEDSHAHAGLFSRELINECKSILRQAQRNIRRGTAWGLQPEVSEALGELPEGRDASPALAVDRLADDLRQFQRRHRLERVVVVNVASSEPAAPKQLHNLSYDQLRKILTGKRRSRTAVAGRRLRPDSAQVPSSCLYALAAIDAGCPYINFTPSTGISLPAIRQHADQVGLPYMGNDGKTGETLVKSALAPMFAMRNLSVLSWVGQNILGNRDGAVLRNPRAQASKLRTKDGVISRIVGGSPMTQVSIDYVPSLDDWKVAWDFIHFEGFLGTKMSMQFTWQGCDSILAAPLIIDLARFTVLEARRGAAGPMPHLAFFFKEPMGVDVHDLAAQWAMLVGHVTKAGTRH